jgi:phytoene dehydrogenase-like protein
VDDTAAALGADGRRWRAIFGPLTRAFDDLAAEIVQPVLHVPSHPVKMARFGALSGLPASLLARAWSTTEGRALFAGVAAHAFRPFGAPMSSAIGVTLGTAAHRYGWPVAEGGSSAISGAMIRLLEEHGATFETGVRVASLDELGSPAVVMLDVAPAAAEGEVARGRMPERPYVLVCQQYLADPTRSAGDTHPLYAYAHVPAGYTGDATAAIEAQIERFAPGFRDRILARHVRSAAQMEQHNPNYVGGDIVTGANDPRQMVFRPRVTLNPYATGVPGVFICSAATPPGAGAHGMCGYNAAHAALRRLDPSLPAGDRGSVGGW